LKEVRHGCHRHAGRLRTQRRHAPWRTTRWDGSRTRQQGFSLQVPPPCHTPRPSKPARTRNPGQDPPMPPTPSPTDERLRAPTRVQRQVHAHEPH
jgi:hypothetical protein